MSILRAALHLTIGKTLDDGREVCRTYEAKLITGTAPGWDLSYVDEDGEEHTYQVRVGRTGQATCTCRDSGFRGKECKHILATRQLGILKRPKGEES